MGGFAVGYQRPAQNSYSTFKRFIYKQKLETISSFRISKKWILHDLSGTSERSRKNIVCILSAPFEKISIVTAFWGYRISRARDFWVQINSQALILWGCILYTVYYTPCIECESLGVNIKKVIKMKMM